MKNNLILFSILILFSPFLNSQTTYQPEYNYIRDNGIEPSTYLVSKFQRYDLVLLGEDHGIKNHLDFVQDLIPQLYRNGVTNLCMEFGAFEMQARLDSLLNADKYDEQTARDMMFYYNVGWAYKEYTDIYRKVWEFNKTLPAGKKKFRIVNISYQYDWSEFGLPRNPENMSKVFYRGTPDDFRTRIIEKEVIEKNEKALIYMGLVHVFTKYKMPVLKMNNDDFCDYDTGFVGNRLYRKYPDKVFNIMFHLPFEAKTKAKGFWGSPADGAIEVIMNMNGNKPVGFDLDNTPLGRLPDNSVFSMCYNDFRMEDFFDGYIFISPFKNMTGCTMDSLFFKGRDWKEIKRQMPDPDWHTAGNLDDYYKQISDYVDIKKRYADVIRNSVPTVATGTIERYTDFASTHVQPRNVDVWLPEGYSPSRKYSVIYMHDGQALFDKHITWNSQEWDADSIVGRLVVDKKIKDCIIVGIWNNGKFRYPEYFPQKPYESLPEDLRKRMDVEVQSDNYLRFIVEELKPYIDKHYSTKPDRENTIVMGSSMGGLISVYAICEYPEIFGAAACLSTHWIGDSGNPENNEIPQAFVNYLKSYLPSPDGHKIYFDYGTEGIDKYYKTHQLLVDDVMQQKGYTSKEWLTKEFIGKDHSESAWNERLHIPLEFLIPQE
ncbi:alpha/beta hydrolase-fold protein [Dysgonomonas sp. 521]|uniref:alpha/beta hydrolase-fold protein n=1 Tax=Dysgonomonas sp. 521 TaxID=2302932 RepID=UPI0013D3D1A6|nr:alpha/beta hydrolase-fold protein [Dysgonomonas sp. 521]